MFRRSNRFSTRQPSVGGAVDYALLEALQDTSTADLTTVDQYVRVWQGRSMKGDLAKRARAVLAARNKK